MLKIQALLKVSQCSFMKNVTFKNAKNTSIANIHKERQQFRKYVSGTYLLTFQIHRKYDYVICFILSLNFIIFESKETEGKYSFIKMK